MIRRRGRRGAAYVIALVALVTGLTLALAALRLSVNYSIAESRRQNADAALQLAEAGVDYAFWLTKWTFLSTRPYTDTTNFGAGSFTITIADNSAALAATDRITSTATVRGTTRKVVRVVVQKGGPSPFEYSFALFTTPSNITKAISTAADCPMFVKGNVTFDNAAINMAGAISATGTITRKNGTFTGTQTPLAPAFSWPNIDLAYYQSQAAVYYSSSTTVTNLTFPYDGAIVYVNGALTLKGVITGTGTCVAGNGNLVVDGATQAAGSVVALMTQKTLQLKANVTSLRGICYAHKSDASAVIRFDAAHSLTGPMAGDKLNLNSNPNFHWDSTIFNSATYTLLKLPGFY